MNKTITSRLPVYLSGLVFSLLMAAPVAAQPLSIEELVALESVVAAELSPDGERIAYLKRVPRTPYVDEDGSAYRELHVVDLDGHSRGYITGDVSIREIEWSPDGSRIYYLAERGDAENAALYEIPLTGGESRLVYAHENSIGGFELAPDGDSLIFTATEAAPEENERLRELGFDAVVYEESARFTRAWRLTLDGDDPEATGIELPGSVSAVTFSPDGEHFAVALAPTPLIDDFYLKRSITIVDTESLELVGEVAHDGKLGDFAFSPDGRRLAFIGAQDPNDPREGRLFVVPAEGGEPRQVTRDYPGHIWEFLWRDNSTLAYVGYRGVWTEIETLDLDAPFEIGSEPESGPIVGAVHGREGVDHMAVVAETPEHPDEVYVYTPGEGFRRLTNSNPLLDQRDLAGQEVLRYEARDGLELEGILVRPLNYEEGERYPLVIGVHGGPETHYSNGWVSSYALPAQAMAAEGFAFFFPNYRASTGRGVEFSKLDHRDPAGREFDDLVDAKKHLVDIGLADDARVGVSGTSYGGYATMWAASALTEHFAAGVAFVGISSNIGLLGTSDIPQELYQVHFRLWPWEDWEFWLERSPIYHTGQARTPLLILGGSADPRVDPSQSLTMYRYMKLRNDTPVRLVQYPGEGHGNADTPAQLDYALRMRRWMTHFLVEDGDDLPPADIDHAGRLEATDADM